MKSIIRKRDSAIFPLSRLPVFMVMCLPWQESMSRTCIHVNDEHHDSTHVISEAGARPDQRQDNKEPLAKKKVQKALWLLIPEVEEVVASRPMWGNSSIFSFERFM
jgi:hypothetical protein